MKRNATIAVLISTMLLAACHKREKTEDAAAPATAPAAAPAASATPAPAAATPPAEQTPEQRDLARKQSALDYGIMEDKYINDPRAQWAADAKASSVFGDDNGKTPSEVNMAKNVVGPADGHDWTNNSTDRGFDWIETTYAKPVNATEVRVIVNGGVGVQAINKVELQGEDGKWNTVWNAISDVKPDTRGNRTWFVRTFDKTAYKTKVVKVTYANNLDHDYKRVDAIQLVGD